MKRIFAVLCILVLTCTCFAFTAKGDSDDGTVTMPNKPIPTSVVHHHTFGVWTEEAAATCTQTGMKSRVCSGCGYTQHKAVDSLGHDFTETVIPPTETHAGFTLYSCTRCSYKYRSDEQEAIGHDYQVTVVEPTCTDYGYTLRNCSRCGVKLVTTRTDALGHDYQAVVTPPTATEKGYTTHTCSRCGDSYVDSYTDVTSGWEVSDIPFGTTTTAATVSLTKCSVKAIKNQTYTGKAKKPSLTVTYKGKKLKVNTDYTLSYKNNKKIGKATVTVKGKGAYTGSLKKTFKIVPKGTKLSKLTSPKTKQLKITWKKQTKQTSGYQIQYGTSSKFKKAKTVTVKGAKKAARTVKKLKKGKKYFVRIRTYKTVGKVKYVSAWSKAKSLKIK